MVKFLGRSQAKELRIIASQAKQGEKLQRKSDVFSSLNGNDNINLHFCLETYESKKQNYNLLLPNATYLLHPSLAFTNCQIQRFSHQNKGFYRFFSQIKVFKGFQQN